MSENSDFFSMMFEAAYKARIEWFKMLNSDIKKGGIVLVGDSLTQEFPIHEMMDAYGKIHNRGIGGDTSTGLLKRINESIVDMKPSQVFLLIGTNDLPNLNGNFLPLIDNIGKIIDITLAACPKTEFYLISLYPVNNTNSVKIDSFSVSTRTNKQIDNANIRLKQLTLEKSVHYLDFNRLLKDDSGNLKLDYTREGLHLSPKGYKMILKEMQKYFKLQC